MPIKSVFVYDFDSVIFLIGLGILLLVGLGFTVAILFNAIREKIKKKRKG